MELSSFTINTHLDEICHRWAQIYRGVQITPFCPEVDRFPEVNRLKSTDAWAVSWAHMCQTILEHYGRKCQGTYGGWKDGRDLTILTSLEPDQSGFWPLYHLEESEPFDLPGKGATRAEDAQGTPTQSHVSPNILVYEDKTAWNVEGKTAVKVLICSHFKNSLEDFKDFYLKAKARTWPWLSYLCHLRSTAARDEVRVHVSFPRRGSVRSVLGWRRSTFSCAIFARQRHHGLSSGEPYNINDSGRWELLHECFTITSMIILCSKFRSQINSNDFGHLNYFGQNHSNNCWIVCMLHLDVVSDGPDCVVQQCLYPENHCQEPFQIYFNWLWAMKITPQILFFY